MFGTTPSFGIGVDPLDPAQDIVSFGAEIEGLGFSSCWIADSPLLWREAHVLMASMAAVTHRIVIGTGVTNPLTRHPTVMAGTYATLDELAPGRIAIGIGRGDSAVLMAGLKPATTAALEAYIRDVKDLLGGQAVRLADVDARLWSARPVPVFVSATGPKTLQMAARVADGAILGFLTEPDQVLAARALIADEASRQGRDLSMFRTIGWIWCSVADDIDEARRAVRVHVARHLMHQAATPADVPEALIEEIRHAYRYDEHMHPEARHAELVPPELVDRFAIVGDADQVRHRIKAMLDAGVDHLVLIPGGEKNLVHRTARRLGHEVLPTFSEGGES